MVTHLVLRSFITRSKPIDHPTVISSFLKVVNFSKINTPLCQTICIFPCIRLFVNLRYHYPDICSDSLWSII